MDDFKTIIGLEVHAQLNTKSKMFCSCDNNAEGKKINELTCPVCMGMPGTLPSPNREAIEKTIKAGLAIGCKINEVSKFDRKHYFYPDLPKGYQISQYDQPFCVGGEIEIEGVKIRFNRIHLEEDAGKLLHPKGSKFSIVDLNRAGTPLMEMVTEPDIPNPHIAKLFLQELQQILRALGVSSADMEKGHMRCDANISVVREAKSSPIVELKNLNSFKFVEKALLFEEKRLRDEFNAWPENKTKQTRRFDATLGKTSAMREKEEAKDYRYFPEPDVPPIETKGFDLDKLRAEINKLPQTRRQELVSLGFSNEEANIILKNSEVAQLLESIDDQDKSVAGKLLINIPTARELSIEQLKEITAMVKEGHPSNWVRDMIKKTKEQGKLPSEITANIENAPSPEDVKKGVLTLVNKIFTENPDEAHRFKSGEKALINFFVGQAMKISGGAINPKEVIDELNKRLEK